MKERSVIHSTFVIERSYAVTPQRVFAFFADPAKKRRWFAPDEGAQIEEYEMDFRVGGRERKSFRFDAGPPCENDTIYQDILPDRRIVFAYTMTIGDHRMSSCQSTVELLPTEKGTDLIFTEQAAFFENSDGPEIREKGWRLLLDRMASELGR
ncbi:MAG: SRPBCC family protein [Candidatus Acidiferrales bacterium]